MAKLYKILIRDASSMDDKRRLKVRVNMKIDDIQNEIKQLFESREESAKVAEKS